MARTRKTQITSKPPAGLSNEERVALLDKRVTAETREFAAILRSRTDFEAVLARGTPVDSRVHIAGLLTAVAVGLGVGATLSAAGALAIAMAAALPIGYGLLWLFLASTGGEQLQTLSIDKEGRIASSFVGHGPEWRADVLKVAIPAVVIAVAGWITLGLIHDIIFPPLPSCMFPVTLDKEFCRFVGGMGGGLGLTVGQTKGLERAIRALQLTYSVGFLLGATWFLRRMLTGRWVADARPVRRGAS